MQRKDFWSKTYQDKFSWGCFDVNGLSITSSSSSSNPSLASQVLPLSSWASAAPANREFSCPSLLVFFLLVVDWPWFRMLIWMGLPSLELGFMAPLGQGLSCLCFRWAGWSLVLVRMVAIARAPSMIQPFLLELWDLDWYLCGIVDPQFKFVLCRHQPRTKLCGTQGIRQLIESPDLAFLWFYWFGLY